MLTKFETKSARVKGNGGAGLGPCWGSRGGRASGSHPPPGPLSGGDGRLPRGCSGPLGSQVRGGLAVTSLCLGRAQLSPQAAVDPHQPAQWRHPAVGLSDVHPYRQIRRARRSVGWGGLGPACGGRLGCEGRKGGSAEVMLRLLPV